MPIVLKPAVPVLILGCHPDERTQYDKVEIVPGTTWGFLSCYDHKKGNWYMDAEILVVGITHWFSRVSLREE